MNLVACDAPAGALDQAPHTALRQDTLTEHWDGFWGGDDRYYARCTAASGGVWWFTLEDSSLENVDCPAELASSVVASTSLLAAPPTPPFPSRRIRHAVVFRVGRSASHRCIVGVRRSLKRARSADISA